MGVLHHFPDTAWAGGDGAPTRGVEALLEAGGVLVFPSLRFELQPGERRFLNAAYADPAAKNISLRMHDELRGAVLRTGEEHEALRAMLVRFRDQAEALTARLFPHYAGSTRRGNASFRPVQVEGRVTSWRKDDTRLHVDAFPSNPMRGTRLLRVFTNVHPAGAPRRWKIGEPFAALAARYVPQIGRPLPGAAWLLAALHVTKSRRSEYDHIMLQLHDRMKADLDYQRHAPQQQVDFAPGTTWVCYSDQVLHAVLGGQFMFEHTQYLEPSQQLDPQTSPLRVLEALTGRPLLQG
jgi:hypothetical protein